MEIKKTINGVLGAGNLSSPSDIFVSSYETEGFNDLLKTVNGVSQGLKLSMPNKDLLAGYSSVLNFGNSFSTEVYNLNKNLKLADNQIGSISSLVSAPISGAVASIGALNASMNQNLIFGNVDSSIIESTKRLSGLCIDTLKEQDKIFSVLAPRLNQIESMASFMNNVNPLRMVSGGLMELTGSLYPNSLSVVPDLGVLNEKISLNKKEKSDCQKKLDDILRKINPELVEFRHGCWEAFNKKGKDYIGQSSSSMRRLVDNLFRHIAPIKEVEKTKYFINNKDAKTERGLPNRRANIYYLLDYDKDQAEHFKRLAKGLLETYDNLSSWDHIPGKRDEFVHGVFIVIEGHLLSLLSIWKEKS